MTWFRDGVDQHANHHAVREPGGETRPATAADSLIRINGDGTVEIAEDVEVFVLDGHYWLRTPRLVGWASVAAGSPIVLHDREVDAQQQIRAALHRQGRDVQPLPPGLARR